MSALTFLIKCSLVSAPPAEARPYINEGCFYEEALYGNEWIINLYLLYKHGVALIGPDSASLVNGVNIDEVKKACVRDFLKEWQPRINDLEWLSSSPQHSYTILTLCRILYTVIKGEVTSKTSAALWAKTGSCSEFRQLIDAAEAWQPGKEITLKAETVKFIEFISTKIADTHIYIRSYKDKLIKGESENELLNKKTRGFNNSQLIMTSRASLQKLPISLS